MFPRKVASTLRIKAEPEGFFESVWTGLEECVTLPLMSTPEDILTGHSLDCACRSGMSVRGSSAVSLHR